MCQFIHSPVAIPGLLCTLTAVAGASVNMNLKVLLQGDDRISLGILSEERVRDIWWPHLASIVSSMLLSMMTTLSHAEANKRGTFSRARTAALVLGGNDCFLSHGQTHFDSYFPDD